MHAWIAAMAGLRAVLGKDCGFVIGVLHVLEVPPVAAQSRMPFFTM